MATIGTGTIDTTTQGAWVGKYGASDYALLNWAGSSGGASSTTDVASTPDITYTPGGSSFYCWSAAGSIGDARFLTNPAQTQSAAATWYNVSGMTITFSNNFNGNLSLYALDFDPAGRAETVELACGAASNTTSLGTPAMEGGMYVTWPIVALAGDVFTVTVTLTAGANDVLAGLFLDPPPPSPTNNSGFLMFM